MALKPVQMQLVASTPMPKVCFRTTTERHLSTKLKDERPSLPSGSIDGEDSGFFVMPAGAYAIFRRRCDHVWKQAVTVGAKASARGGYADHEQRRIPSRLNPQDGSIRPEQQRVERPEAN